jgi:hypothetical protein
MAAAIARLEDLQMYIDDLARSAALAALAEGLEITEAEPDITADERYKIRLGTLIKAERDFLKDFAPDAQSAAAEAWERGLEYGTKVMQGKIKSDEVLSLSLDEAAAMLAERRGG